MAGDWWANAIRRAATVLVVEIGGKIAGYATIGRNRARELPQQGEIYELYLGRNTRASGSAAGCLPPRAKGSPATA